MPTTDLRRKLRWLIAIRAIISTALLGSATFAQINSPGSFPIDPFFFLIGLTYALTIIYAVTVRGSRLFPLMKVYRRLTLGDEEDLRSFYTMVTARLGNPAKVN